jgi:hypothetical protein
MANGWEDVVGNLLAFIVVSISSILPFFAVYY